MPGQYGFLDQALQDYINAIQSVWGANFQTVGITILLGLGAIAFAVYAIQLLMTGDPWTFIMGFAMTVLSLALLYGFFLFSQTLATEVYNGMLAWGQQLTGLSPAVLTPSGIMETGLRLARIFWGAAGAASWFWAPMSALVTIFCATAVVIAFGFAAIIYLLAQIEVWTLIVAGFVLLAFAALPWTWHLFTGWGISVLSICIKLFFILAILAVGLTEAQGWTDAMAGSSASIIDDASQALQAMIESLLFFGLIYYIPGLLAAKILGATGSVMNAGEALLAGAAGAEAGAAISTAQGALHGAVSNVAQSARAAVNAMLLR